MFSSYPPEEEFTSSKTLKQELINNDKQKLLLRKKEGDGGQSLLSMIAFYLNHPGCKYKKNELREVGYFEFMYNIQRLQIYESTRAIYGGLYVLVAVMAHKRRRSVVAWLLISLIASPLLIIIILLLIGKNDK